MALRDQQLIRSLVLLELGERRGLRVICEEEEVGIWVGS